MSAVAVSKLLSLSAFKEIIVNISVKQLENQLNVVKLEDVTANPAPLGLMGFGMTTVLLNLHNAGLFD